MIYSKNKASKRNNSCIILWLAILTLSAFGNTSLSKSEPVSPEDMEADLNELKPYNNEI